MSNSIISCLKKYRKKRLLLKKYKNTELKKLQMIYLLDALKGDDISSYVIHIWNCENRCYKRIKELKSK